jgi:hypothetical protein
MIYFTTFIFTLLLAHIARAAPACADFASPEDMYDPMYDSEQLISNLGPTKVIWEAGYDNKDNTTRTTVSCKDLGNKYPHFDSFPDFPYIGGAADITADNSPNCGKCWKLTDTKTKWFTYILAINKSKPGFGFDISKEAFKTLSGGPLVPATSEVDFVPVPSHFCDFKKP